MFFSTQTTTAPGWVNDVQMGDLLMCQLLVSFRVGKPWDTGWQVDGLGEVDGQETSCFSDFQEDPLGRIQLFDDVVCPF